MNTLTPRSERKRKQHPTVEFDNRSTTDPGPTFADAGCEPLADLIPKAHTADDGVGCIHNRCIRT
jgi:hypothetical protein